VKSSGILGDADSHGVQIVIRTILDWGGRCDKCRDRNFGRHAAHSCRD
jgi:hypothetical protein